MGGVCFSSSLMAWIIATSKAYTTGQAHLHSFEASTALTAFVEYTLLPVCGCVRSTQCHAVNLHHPLSTASKT